MKLTNPVIPGFYPDPSVCRVGEDYYLVTSSFEYFPGVPIFHSRDLVNWRQIGHCLTRAEQLPLDACRSGGGIFAPTIRRHRGRFYMVTTNVCGMGHFYVHADDSAGEWSEPILVDQCGIDPSLLFDDDGTVYFTSNGPYGIFQSTIDIATGERTTEVKKLWGGTGGRFPEAPHLYKLGRQYYLMIAEGGTELGHMETIARSDSPWGPFEPCPHNPILAHWGHGYHAIQATGHADLIEDHTGRWWAVFLAIRPVKGKHHIGRETYLAPVTWTEDGWPLVNGGRPIELESDVDGLPPHPWPAEPVRDDFDAPALRMSWNHLRNPREADTSLTERPGWLRLRGSALTLDEVDAPTFVGRRLCHNHFRAETLLDFEPAVDGEEAGLTLRRNEQHHYELLVTRLDGRRQVIVRCRVGHLNPVIARQPIDDGPVRLRIIGEPERVGMAFAVGDGDWTHLADGDTRYLSSEVAGGHTGTYVAMFASGNGKACTVPADFDGFDYEALPVPEDDDGD